MTLAPIGSLLNKTVRRAKKERKKFPDYLALVRQCPCVICGKTPSESAHIRYSSAAYGKVNPGVGSKPHDKFVIALCDLHHRLGKDSQHEIGNEELFWNKHGIDPLAVAEKLWEARDLGKMQEICTAVRTKENYPK